MRKRIVNNWYFLVLMGLILVSCETDLSPQERYEQTVSKELASGKRQDSIFLGMYLGMENKEFYRHCWEMNQKGLFMDGMGNTAVAYVLPELEKKGQMYFFPEFTEDGKIYAMDVEFAYDDWAPWNKASFSNKLIVEVIRILGDWYGEDFIKVPVPNRATVLTQISGNRRVAVWLGDDRVVRARILDLSVKPDEALLL